MRFTVNKNEFLKGLSSAGHAVGNKVPVPLLLNLKLDLNERGLEITGSDNEITIRTAVPYMIEQKQIIRDANQGAILVNAHIITEVIRRLSADELTFEVVDNSVAKIDDGTSSFKLNCVAADEYPDIDLEANGTTFSMKCSDLSGLVEQSAFAASSKEQRPILTALNLDANGGVLTATATDSARLARKSIPVDPALHFSCNIPARFIIDITHLFENEPNVTISISEKKALFSFGNTVVASRLLAGDYPVTQAIIPQTFNFYLEANAAELLNAMSRVSILSADREPVVRLSMRDDGVEVSSKSDLNGSAVEKISTFQFSGDRLDISFNSLFVIDAVKAVKGDDVTIAFIGEMKPFVVKNPKDDSVIELITPMRTF